jgi:hypothetical protein
LDGNLATVIEHVTNSCSDIILISEIQRKIIQIQFFNI